MLRAASHLDSTPGGGPTADSAHQSFPLGHLAGGLYRVLVVDLHHLVDHVEVENVGDEARSDSLDRMPAWPDRLAGELLGDHRAIGRLDRHDLDPGLAALERLTDAGDRAAGADAADEDVHLAFGVLPDLKRRGATMDLRVGRVLELLGHKVLAAGAGDVFGMANGTRHAVGSRREHEFSAEGLEHPPPLEAHALRHRDAELVATGRADIGQPDAGVAAGGLDNDRVWADPAVPLGRVDHRAGDPVLDAPERIHILDLADHRRHAALGHPPQANKRRAADALGNVFPDAGRKLGRVHIPTSSCSARIPGRSPPAQSVLSAQTTAKLKGHVAGGGQPPPSREFTAWPPAAGSLRAASKPTTTRSPGRRTGVSCGKHLAIRMVAMDGGRRSLLDARGADKTYLEQQHEYCGFDFQSVVR